MKLKPSTICDFAAISVILKMVDDPKKETTHGDISSAMSVFNCIKWIGDCCHPNYSYLNRVHKILRGVPYINSRKENWGGYCSPIIVYTLDKSRLHQLTPRELIDMRTHVAQIKAELASLNVYVQKDNSLQEDARVSKYRTTKLITQTLENLKP